MMGRRALLASTAALVALAGAPGLASAAVYAPGVPADGESFASKRVEPILMVPVRFEGEPTASPLSTVAEMEAEMVGFRDYFLRSSNGNIDYQPEVAEWTTIPRSAARGRPEDGSKSLENTVCYQWDSEWRQKGLPESFDWSSLEPAVMDALRAQQPGIDQTKFKRFMFLTPNPYRGDVDGKPTFDDSCPGGLGYHNPWLYGRNLEASRHEWMHAIGLNHGSSVKCTERDAAVPLGSNCSFVGTTDATDAQNTVAGGEVLTMNGLHRLVSGSLPTDNVLVADTSVTRDYTITNVEETVSLGTKQILKVPRGTIAGETLGTKLPYYYVDYQRPKSGFASVAGSSDSLLRGVTIRRGPQATVGQSPTDQQRTVNPTPGRGDGDFTWNARSRFTSTDGRGFNRLDPDLTLKVGQSIWDPQANLTLTTKSLTSTTATVEVRPGKPTATGAMVSLVNGVLKAEQTSSRRANLIVSKDQATGRIFVADYGSAIRVTAPCVIENVQTASCPGTATAIELRGGAGDDTFAIADSVGTIPAKLFGGAGNDSLEGGPGNDLLDGGPGADAIDGGKGDQDTVSYAGRTAGVFAEPSKTESAATRVQERGRGEVGENDGISHETENVDAPTAIKLPTANIGSPSGNVYTNDTSVGMTFSADNQSGRAVRYDCTFYGNNPGDWKACTPGQEFRGDLSQRVADGRRVFDYGVRAVDASSGVVLGIVAYRQGQLLFDNEAPDTTVTKEPTGAVPATGTTFEFTSPNRPQEGGCRDWNSQGETCVSFEAKIDGQDWVEVESPWDTGALDAGVHNIKIRARDLAGNVDADPEEFNIYVVPQVSITGGPADGSWPKGGELPVRLTFSSPNTGVTGYKCTNNGGTTWVACTSPWTVPSPTADGVAKLGVRAVAGIIHSPIKWRTIGYDRVAPTPQINGIAEGGQSASSLKLTWTVTGEPAVAAPIESYGCRLDDAQWSACPTSKSIVLTGLTPGQHSFSVYAYDTAWNVSYEVRRTFTVVTPTLMFTSGPNDWQYSSTRRPTYGFKADPAANVTFECAITGFDFVGGVYTPRAPSYDFAPCTSPYTPPAALNGAYGWVRIRMIGADGNEVGTGISRIVSFT